MECTHLETNDCLRRVLVTQEYDDYRSTFNFKFFREGKYKLMITNDDVDFMNITCDQSKMNIHLVEQLNHNSNAKTSNSNLIQKFTRRYSQGYKNENNVKISNIDLTQSINDKNLILDSLDSINIGKLTQSKNSTITSNNSKNSSENSKHKKPILNLHDSKNSSEDSKQKKVKSRDNKHKNKIMEMQNKNLSDKKKMEFNVTVHSLMSTNIVIQKCI